MQVPNRDYPEQRAASTLVGYLHEQDPAPAHQGHVRHRGSTRPPQRTLRWLLHAGTNGRKTEAVQLGEQPDWLHGIGLLREHQEEVGRDHQIISDQSGGSRSKGGEEEEEEMQVPGEETEGRQKPQKIRQKPQKMMKCCNISEKLIISNRNLIRTVFMDNFVYIEAFVYVLYKIDCFACLYFLQIDFNLSIF